MPTSPQIDSLSTSTNVDNIQAKLQPKSHFWKITQANMNNLTQEEYGKCNK